MTGSQIRGAAFDAIRKVVPEAGPARLQPGEDLRQALDID